MLERKRGTIVNVSSMASKTGSPNELVHYAAAKAALETSVQYIAEDLGKDGIRVNAVAPGVTMTDEEVRAARLRNSSES